jgi:hypothetical protein
LALLDADQHLQSFLEHAHTVAGETNSGRSG